MPTIHTSLLTPVPAGVGHTLPGLCNEGVRRYMVTRLPAKAVRDAPANLLGTNGAKRIVPRPISAAARALRNLAGGILARNGKAPAATPCTPCACSSPPLNFSIPV